MYTRTWTSSRGMVRTYVNEWAELIGLDVAFYKSGNVSSAALNGKGISNAEANRIQCAKVWIDEAGAIHVDGLASRTLTADVIREAVAAELARQAVSA